MPSLDRRWIAVLLLVAICAGGLAWALLPISAHGPLHIILIDDPPPTPPASVAYVTGAINHPGVYPLRTGERLADLVAAAGGLTADADLRRINLAARVGDGEHVELPLLNATPEQHVKVRLNRASRAELLSLPGLTVQQAVSIQDSVRKQGPIRSPDELVLRKLCSTDQVQRFATLIDWSP